MSKIYQVMQYIWNYDGECFQTGDQVVHSTHPTKAEADRARLELEKSFWFSTDLNQVANFFDNRPNEKKADKFLQDELGVSFDDIGALPPTLSDDGLLRFLKATGAKAARVVSIDTNQKYLVLKFSDVDVYMRRAVEEWEAPTYLDKIVKAKSLSSLKIQSKWNIRTNLELLGNFKFSGRDLVLQGTFEDLSDAPAELEKVWRKYRQIRYKKKEAALIVNGGSADALFDLNEVLKQPLFTVEELTFDEIGTAEAREQKLSRSIKKSDPGYAHKYQWLDRLL